MIQTSREGQFSSLALCPVHFHAEQTQTQIARSSYRAGLICLKEVLSVIQDITFTVIPLSPPYLEQSIPLVKDMQITRHHTVQVCSLNVKCSQLFMAVPLSWMVCSCGICCKDYRTLVAWGEQHFPSCAAVPAVSLWISEVIKQKGNGF